jgi:hypothetical protein
LPFVILNKAIGNYEEAVSWANVALANGKQYFKDFSGEERIIVKKLSQLYISYAYLLELNNDFATALKYIVELNFELSKYVKSIPDTLTSQILEISTRLNRQLSLV